MMYGDDGRKGGYEVRCMTYSIQRHDEGAAHPLGWRHQQTHPLSPLPILLPPSPLTPPSLLYQHLPASLSPHHPSLLHTHLACHTSRMNNCRSMLSPMIAMCFPATRPRNSLAVSHGYAHAFFHFPRTNSPPSNFGHNFCKRVFMPRVRLLLRVPLRVVLLFFRLPKGLMLLEMTDDSKNSPVCQNVHVELWKQSLGYGHSCNSLPL